MNSLKLCQVCGDEASGFNYGGLSCKSCKVFFHRHANKHQTVTCKKETSCTIDILKRGRCIKCRLDKCVATGMVREKMKNELNFNILQVQNCADASILKAIMHVIDAEQTNRPEIKPKYKLKTKKFLNNLNSYEIETISEVQTAFSVFIDERNIPNIRMANDFLDSLGSIDLYIKMIGKFCKRLQPFNRLDTKDQFLIFKPFCFDIMMLRFAYLYDLKIDGCVTIEDEYGNYGVICQYDLWKSEETQNLIDFNKSFTISLQNEMENDKTILDLLAALQLFKPQTNGLSCTEFLQYYHIFYSRLLCRYLENKYNSVQVAKQKFVSLMSMLNNFELVKQNETAMLNQFDKHLLPHVLVEMYNLY